MTSARDNSSTSSAQESGAGGSFDSGGAPQGSSAQGPSAALPGAVGEKARARARVGTTVNGKWSLEALLGVGGMASVYAATHRNGSRAALKILHAEFARDPSIRDRFLREGYVANKIDHAGRVAILDDDVTELNEPFLVMELLEGETVQQLWRRKKRRLPVEEALPIAAHVLDTLTHFHAQGIVHRDLKPANVFVTQDAQVKLLDFGVARMREGGTDKTRAGTALGTPSFMAPEQAMGLTDNVDGRADIFSIGATLYALLSGQRLHQGRSDNEAFILAATQPAPSLARIAPELPVEVIALVDRALAWDPRNRFQTAAAMIEEIQRVLNGGSSAHASPADANAGPAPGRDAMAEMRPDEDVAADDPGVVRLAELFRRLDRLLATVRQYGWEHPEADNKLRGTFQSMVEALRDDPARLYWTLRPYSFLHRGQTIWEPGPPFDAVPYNLFAAGIRMMRITTGVTEAELRSLCEVLLIDPVKDLAPEDDVAAALWERRIEHVSYDVINVFAEGDAENREHFYEEADELERLARRATETRANVAEAAAMSVETDRDALRAAREAAGVLGLDVVARKALAAQLSMSAERWSERFMDVLTFALVDAKRRGDVGLVTEPVAASVCDMILDRRFDRVFAMHEAASRAMEANAPRIATAAMRAELTRGMFSPDTLRLLVREAVRPVAGPGALRPVDLDAVAVGLAPVLAELGVAHLDTVMEVIGGVSVERLRGVLLTYVERVLPGHEVAITDRLMTLDLEVARPLLRMIAALRSPGSVEALRRLAGCVSPTLRCEALAHLAASPEQLKDELMALAEGQDAQLRFAALRTLAQHQVRAAGPLLVRRVTDASFHQLSADERRELMGALHVLNPGRAESLAIELLQKHGLLADDAVDQTRAICAELLGREGKTNEALEAVVGATRRRPWNSASLRDAAATAAEAIAARLGRRISAGGEIQ